MEKSPGFFFYVGDWIDVKVIRMSLKAQGAYFRLLCHMWKDSKDQCSLENNPLVVARILGIPMAESDEIMSEIQWPGDPMFYEKDGKYFSKRLQHEKNEQVRKSKNRSESGKKGAENRWQGHTFANGNAISKRMANDSVSVSSSVSISISELNSLSDSLKLNQNQVHSIRVEVAKAFGHKLMSEANEVTTTELLRKVQKYTSNRKDNKSIYGYALQAAKNLKKDLAKV